MHITSFSSYNMFWSKFDQSDHSNQYFSFFLEIDILIRRNRTILFGEPRVPLLDAATALQNSLNHFELKGSFSTYYGKETMLHAEVVVIQEVLCK